MLKNKKFKFGFIAKMAIGMAKGAIDTAIAEMEETPEKQLVVAGKGVLYSIVDILLGDATDKGQAIAQYFATNWQGMSSEALTAIKNLLIKHIPDRFPLKDAVIIALDQAIRALK